MNLSFSFAILITALLLLSCASSSQQREFERDAFQDPLGITRTNAQGEVQNTDDDDWRISPLFQSIVEVNPPFPNPAAVGDRITFEIAVTGVQAVEGIVVFERLNNGNLAELFSTVDTQTSTTFIVFELNPLLLQDLGNGNGPRGLHRILIYDFNNQLISYGDVEIE